MVQQHFTQKKFFSQVSLFNMGVKKILTLNVHLAYFFTNPQLPNM